VEADNPDSGRKPTMTSALLDDQAEDAVATAAAPACAGCPHALDTHDAIALRYCRATVAGAFDRGCVCRTG
jgi:hypothetical protein